MVRTLHRAGIEVILDVVYNHTAEGNHLGPTLSFRGIDNQAYYRLVAGDPQHYYDTTGTGNSLNVRHHESLRLIMDSLRYWVTEMHVDGFRFDLASAPGPGVPRGRPAGRVLRPGQPGPGGQPGQADRRAVGRRRGRLPGRRVPAAVDGVERQVPRHGARLLARRAGQPRRVRRRGSPARSDLYEADSRRPIASINFVTAHDGFTLNDLVSYNDKHNEANGEDNRDGESHNRSWNHGVGGPDRRRRDRGAAGTAEAQPPRHAAAVPGRADDRARRRARPHPAGQQQRLLPGQRAQLGRLGRRARQRGAHRVHRPARRPARRAPGLPPAAVLPGPPHPRARTSTTSPGCAPTAGR